MPSATLFSLNSPFNRDANAYLAAIVESSDDAIISKNLDGTITSWNAAAEKMYGHTANEAIGQHISIIIPTDRMDEEALIIARLKQGDKIDHFETVRQHKGGRQLEVSITISPIRDASGHIIGASKIARDISQRLALERELESKALLLAEKDRFKDEFLAMLAHELRNPLAPVSNALHLIKTGALTAERQKEAVAMASRQIGHMVRLLDDLLDVSRITHGKVVMRKQRMDLRDALKSAVDTAQPLIQSRLHKLQTHLPSGALWVEGDATRLTQLFSNLLNNSAKYTDEGGSITLTAEIVGKNVQVRIRDNGIGIPPDKQSHIFDMFMQVDNSIQRTQGGLGIGLTLVKNIAELHGGSVAVASEGEAGGTEFTVTLPLSEVMAEIPASDALAPSAPAASYRVLVVDDNEAAAKTLGWMLEALGHDVKVVINAKSALQAAASYKPEVVLLDIGMPHINGYELCGLLKKIKELKNSTFIAQTGWGQKQDMQRSKESGFDYHLIKPVSIETLQQQLESLHKPKV